MGRVVVGEERDRSWAEHLSSPQLCCFQEARKAQLENHEPEEEEEEEMETEEKEAGGSGIAGQSKLWEPWEDGKLGLTSPCPAQMRNERRAAAVRRKAVKMSTQAVRVNGRRVTGMRQVTRVAALKMKAVRMRPGLPETKRRSSAVMLTLRTTLTLMMRTEDGPVAVIMIQTAAAMGVASRAGATAGAGAPVPSPVAVSILLRRMAVKLQLLILVKLTVTVTESQGLQGWYRHNYYVQKGTFRVVYFQAFCFVSLFLLQTFAVNKANFSLLPLPGQWSPSAFPPPRCLRHRSKGHRGRATTFSMKCSITKVRILFVCLFFFPK